MSDLNEEWKAGELEDGDYYIKTSGVIIPMYFDGHYFEGADDEDIQEVLAPVPSYEEWQAKDKENQKLKERNDSLNSRDINLCRIANGIRDENFALKGLLTQRRRWTLRSRRHG